MPKPCSSAKKGQRDANTRTSVRAPALLNLFSSFSLVCAYVRYMHMAVWTTILAMSCIKYGKILTYRLRLTLCPFGPGIPCIPSKPRTPCTQETQI